MNTKSRQRWIETDEARRLWLDYKRTGDVRLRDRLIMSYAPLVKFLAYRKAAELPASCNVEDLISAGLVELIGAIDRWDPAKGATLEQFAWTRIHGAIIDQLRKADWAPRSARRLERRLESARRDFAAVQGRPPTRDELGTMVGLSGAEVLEHEHRLEQAEVGSLNVVVGREDAEAGVERIDTLPSDDLSVDPAHAAHVADAKARFREAFDRLPRRQREVAVLLYVKELTLHEIGDLLGVSESRVCQLHGELRRNLARALGEDGALLSAVA
jgi:RNA polymerase sigma factor FliA